MLLPARLLLLIPTAALALNACGESSVRITKREATTTEEGAAPLRVISELSCPEHHGDLIRVETAADGMSCIYTGPRGSKVQLHLVSLASGQPVAEVLAPFEDRVRGYMPDTAGRASGGDGDAAVSVRSDGDNTQVRLPGLSVDQDGEGASINIGGIRIRADGAPTDTGGESVSINAHDNAAEVRTRSRGPDLRATYVLSDETASEDGWRTAGYEARGPASGPFVVAVIRSRDRDEETVMEDAKDLVVLNVGGRPKTV